MLNKKNKKSLLKIYFVVDTVSLNLSANKDVTIIFEASFLPAGKIKLDEHELMTAADERTRAINLKFVITLVRRLE